MLGHYYIHFHVETWCKINLELFHLPMFQYEQNIQINAGIKVEKTQVKTSIHVFPIFASNWQLNQFRFSTTLASLRLQSLLACCFLFVCFLQISLHTGCLFEQVFTGLAFIADQVAPFEKINTSNTALVLTFTRSCAQAQPNATTVYLFVDLW